MKLRVQNFKRAKENDNWQVNEVQIKERTNRCSLNVSTIIHVRMYEIISPQTHTHSKKILIIYLNMNLKINLKNTHSVHSVIT